MSLRPNAICKYKNRNISWEVSKSFKIIHKEKVIYSVRPILLYRYRYIDNLTIYRPISVPIFRFLKCKQTVVIFSKCKQTAVIFQKCKQTVDIYGCVFTFRRIFLTVLTYDVSVPIYIGKIGRYRPIPISSVEY